MLPLLSHARSAGVTIYLSTPSMGDLSALGEDLQQAVIENINRFVIFRQNSPKISGDGGRYCRNKADSDPDRAY